MEFTLRQLCCCWLLRDDEILGAVRDLLFDTVDWRVRHLVIETGTWPRPRRVLLDPTKVVSVNTQAKSVLTTLSQSELNDCPLEAAHPGISHRFAVKCSGPSTVPVHWADSPPLTAQIEFDPTLESAGAIVGHIVTPSPLVRERVVDFAVVRSADSRKCEITFAIVRGRWRWRHTRQVPVIDIERIDIENERLILASPSPMQTD